MHWWLTCLHKAVSNLWFQLLCSGYSILHRHWFHKSVSIHVLWFNDSYFSLATFFVSQIWFSKHFNSICFHSQPMPEFSLFTVCSHSNAFHSDFIHYVIKYWHFLCLIFITELDGKMSRWGHLFRLGWSRKSNSYIFFSFMDSWSIYFRTQPDHSIFYRFNLPVILYCTVYWSTLPQPTGIWFSDSIPCQISAMPNLPCLHTLFYKEKKVGGKNETIWKWLVCA